MKEKEKEDQKPGGVTEGARRATGVTSPGRPMKYDVLIEALEDEGIYCAATIVAFAEKAGYIPSTVDPKELSKAKRKARLSLGSYSRRHNFPYEGDGRCQIPGHGPMRGWYGHRWKAALKSKPKGQDMTNKIPEPEVQPKPRQRKFDAAYKLKVLTQADKCSEPGQISALLRREGLYSSHLCDWRKQRDEGTLAALSKRKGQLEESK